MSAGQPTPEERTRKVAEVAYKEVLDATKHQDDKIGRILTAISFLTAASIAFANMSGVTVTRRFSVGGHTRPLLAFAVGAFVVGVATSVVLLLGSLTTTLTLPGRRPSKKPRNSLIYFYSIVKHGESAWGARWDDPARAESDLRLDYIDETYNLARRTNHKYWRTNEAAAALSFTLFCLGVAVVLGAAAASSRPPNGAAVPLHGPARWTLALYAALYVAVVVLMARRDEWLQRDGVDAAAERARAIELAVVQAAAPLVVALLVVSDTDRWRAGTAVLALAGAVAGGWVTRKDGVTAQAVAVGIGAGIAAVAWLPGDDAWRLLAAAGVPAAIASRQMVQIASRMRASKG